MFTRRKTDQQLLSLLLKASSNAHRSTQLLQQLIADPLDQKDLVREIVICEQQGDQVSHDIIHRLHTKSDKSEVDTSDLQALTRKLDDIVDYAEQSADLLGIYQIEAPMQQAIELSEILVAAAAAVDTAVKKLNEGEELTPTLVEINRLENEGDRIHRAALAALFERAIDPMVVIRWKDIFQSLEHAIDACETVSHLIEGIAIKSGIQ